MSAAVIPIRQSFPPQRGYWSLLEAAFGGSKRVPLGILLIDSADRLSLRLLDSSEIKEEFGEIEEEQIDMLDSLPRDLRQKAAESGAAALIASFENSLSGFLRISDRTAIEFTGNPQRAADRLFDEYVDGEVRPYLTHLPLYGLRAAATKFGEGMESSLDQWLRVPADMRITEDMFIAHVVGRSMEPLIPDGSLCVFRSGVKGTRQGKRLLIEKFDENDFAARYTVKRYTSLKLLDEEGEFLEHTRIRLEPLNPEFEAFDLSPDAFRVIGEFVAVLD